MILDSRENFSNLQLVTTSAASTNFLDLKQNRDIGTGEEYFVTVDLGTLITFPASPAVLTVILQTDDDPSFPTPKDAQTIAVFPAVTISNNTLVNAVLAPGRITERYLRIFYSVANGDGTSWQMTAYLTWGIQQAPTYPAAVTTIQ